MSTFNLDATIRAWLTSTLLIVTTTGIFCFSKKGGRIGSGATNNSMRMKAKNMNIVIHIEVMTKGELNGRSSLYLQLRKTRSAPNCVCILVKNAISEENVYAKQKGETAAIVNPLEDVFDALSPALGKHRYEMVKTVL